MFECSSDLMYKTALKLVTHCRVVLTGSDRPGLLARGCEGWTVGVESGGIRSVTSQARLLPIAKAASLRREQL